MSSRTITVASGSLIKGFLEPLQHLGWKCTHVFMQRHDLVHKCFAFFVIFVNAKIVQSTRSDRINLHSVPYDYLRIVYHELHLCYSNMVSFHISGAKIARA